MGLQIQIDMESVLSQLHIDAQRNSSGEWKAHCPKHYERIGRIDRHPSWSINEDSGLHGCFSCGYKGALVNLVVDMTDMDLWSAMRWLQDEGMQTLQVEDSKEAPEPAINFAPSVEDEWYLFDRPPRRARQDRHLSLEAVKYYDIRWNDGGWCLPINSYDGKFRGYQWKKKSQVLNIPTGVLKGSTLFGLDRFPHSDTLVLVESPLDVLRLYDNDIAGVASFGAMISADQIDLLVSFCENVIIGLDDDAAGRTQAFALHQKLRHIVPSVRFLNYAKTNRRKDTGKYPKDIGDMTDNEIKASVNRAVYGAEALQIGLITNVHG